MGDENDIQTGVATPVTDPTDDVSRIDRGPGQQVQRHTTITPQGTSIQGTTYPTPRNAQELQAIRLQMQRNGVSPAAQVNWLNQLAPTPAAPRGPRPTATMTQSFSQTTQAPVRAETQQQLEDATGAFEGARDAAQADEVGIARRQAQGAQDIADHLGNIERRILDEDADRTARAQTQFRNLQSRIQDVAEARVDPEAYFGGSFGRRMGAAILVGLGNFAAHQRGRDSGQAAQVIQQAVERNLRAQELNQAQTRSAAGMQGQALAQFRQLLGDETAAREAARAAAYTAVQARVQSMLAQARPDQVEGLQALSNAVQEMQAASMQAAADRARWTIETSVTDERRMSHQQAMRQLQQVMGGGGTPGGTPGGAASGAARGGAGRRRVGPGRPGAGRPLQGGPGLSAEDIAAARDEVVAGLDAASQVAVPNIESGGAVLPFDPALWHAGDVPPENRTRALAAAAVSQRVAAIHDQFEALRDARTASNWIETQHHLDQLRVDMRRIEMDFSNTGVLNSPGEIALMDEAIGDITRSDTADWARLTDARARFAAWAARQHRRNDSILSQFGSGVNSRLLRLRRTQGRVDPRPAPEPEGDAGLSEVARQSVGATVGGLAGGLPGLVIGGSLASEEGGGNVGANIRQRADQAGSLAGRAYEGFRGLISPHIDSAARNRSALSRFLFPTPDSE